jgi:hypothetical protein
MVPHGRRYTFDKLDGWLTVRNEGGVTARSSRYPKCWIYVADPKISTPQQTELNFNSFRNKLVAKKKLQVSVLSMRKSQGRTSFSVDWQEGGELRNAASIQLDDRFIDIISNLGASLEEQLPTRRAIETIEQSLRFGPPE